MIYLSVAIGILLVTCLLAPFWLGQGGLLQASASINSPEQLRALKDAILRRYVEDERAHKAGGLSGRTWEQRKAFLTNRYVDAARRLDYLEFLQSSGGAS